MADRRYKLLRDGLVGPRSFDRRDLTEDDLPIWNAVTGKWDLIDATDLVSAETAIMPAGTTVSSTLRWDGAAWVENTEFLTGTGTVAGTFYNVGGNTKLVLNADTGFDAGLKLQSNAVDVAQLRWEATDSVIELLYSSNVVFEHDSTSGKFYDRAAGKGLKLQDPDATWASGIAKVGLHATDSAGSGMGWITWYNQNLYIRVGEAGAVGGLDGSFIRLDGVNTAGVLETLAVFNVEGSVQLYRGGTEVARTIAASSGGLEVNNTSTGAGFERVLTTSDLSAGVTDHGALTGLSDDDHSAVYPGYAQTETISGLWTWTTYAVSTRFGTNGDYSSTGGNSAWGSTIWSMDATWQGTTAGTNGGNPSYGLAWHRNSHANVDAQASEGLYIFRNNTHVAAIGYTGAKFISGIYPGDQSVGHIAGNNSNYGSVNCSGADGSSGTYAGWGVNDRVVFMNNNSTTSGLYNDTNNQWHCTLVQAGAVTLYQAGTAVALTDTDGMRRNGAGNMIFHATDLGNGSITTSTSAPSGGGNGDVWFRY